MKSRQKSDIQERTFEFAVQVAKLVNRLSRTVAGIEIGKQVVLFILNCFIVHCLLLWYNTARFPNGGYNTWN